MSIDPNKCLGKLPAKGDVRALLFAKFLGKDGNAPKQSDFWKRRAAFPMRTFGNRAHGCCTRASQALLAMRMERIETRQTAKITDEEVLRVYYDMTEELYGGGDTGAYEMDALSRWRNPEKTFRDTKGRALTIDAYTRINHLDAEEMKWAIHFSGAKGIKVCFNLPEAWANVDPPAILDVPSDGRFVGEWEPGSWGGHSLMADAYSEKGLRLVHSWYEKGMAKQDEQIVTWKAVAAYCVEAYSVIDSLDSWRKKVKRGMDFDRLVKSVNAVSSIKL